MRIRLAVVALLAVGGLATADPPAPARWPASVTSFLADWATPVGAEKDAATGFPRRIERTQDSMVMVLVPAGTFQMGATPGDTEAKDNEKPRHAVTLSSAYYMDETPVTNEQFARFSTAMKFKTADEDSGRGYIADENGKWKETDGASWRAPLPGGKRPADWEKRPVVLVSWTEADAYSKWIGHGVGLPTEAQYERALRGGVEGKKYPWGDGLPLPAKYGNYADETAKKKFPQWKSFAIEGYDDGYERTSPVRSFAANAYGLYDISGNVWEYCADCYCDYPSGAVTDPLEPASRFTCVVRGSSWYGIADYARSACRSGVDPAGCIDHAGFRLSSSIAAPRPSGERPKERDLEKEHPR